MKQWQKDLEHQLEETTPYLVHLQREATDDEEQVDDRAVAVMVTPPDGSDGTTLVVEAGVQQNGDGFVIARSFDDDGEPKEPSVVGMDGSTMISA